jgi:serine-type D-Ala-D-Ala carboxypeptidase/endopeptidase (penicillin-binding protein 4)
MHRSSFASPTVPRSVLAMGAALACLLGLAAPAAAREADAEGQLRAALLDQMAQGPANAGACVIDLSDGHVVLDDRSEIRRQAASITKLYTTSAALLRLGPNARLSTRVLGTGRRAGRTWRGDLYLRGGGDFTFGKASFARDAYGGGGSVESLAAALRRSGITRVHGSVFGDSSLFSDNGGTHFELVLCRNPLFGSGCPYGPGGSFERPLPNGPRTAIGFDRGLVNATSAKAQSQPTTFAARQLIRALRARGIRVEGAAGARRAPKGARALATTRSPSVARLVALVNPPSDNYAADVMQRVVGASGGDGSRAGGERVILGEIQKRFGIRPQAHTGSGETLLDRTSPREVVSLLIGMRSRPEGAAFARSLSEAGRNGTLLRFKGTVAAGRCQLKDGTRLAAQPNTTLNIAGYCESASGRTFAFAVMMNGMPMRFVPPDRIESPAYALEDTIVKALAGFTG